MLSLTKLVFTKVEGELQLTPLLGQRGVCSTVHRVGTAADFVCFNHRTRRILLVELKCGFSGDKTCAARKDKKVCFMKGTMHKTPDTILNRHLTQLASTYTLFVAEKRTMSMLETAGVTGVDGMLLYVNDAGVETFELTDWWIRRGVKIINFLK